MNDLQKNPAALLKRLGTLSVSTKVTLSVVALLFVFLYALFPYTSGYSFQRTSIARQMVSLYSWEDGEWMFGYAVLPLIAILFSLKWREFTGFERKPSIVGLGIVIVSLFFYWVGYKANNRYFGFASAQLLVMGLIVWFAGWKTFKKAFWLWALLGMMWPLIFLIPKISFPMQLMVTKLTVGFLNLIGVDTIQNGTSFFSAATEAREQGDLFQMKVAAACSGIRSLFALIMMSLVVSYMTLQQDYKRWILVLSIFPIVLFANFIRMMILLVGSLTLGSDVAIGEHEDHTSFFHIAAGLAVYVVALGVLLYLSGLLSGKSKGLFRKKKKVRTKNV